MTAPTKCPTCGSLSNSEAELVVQVVLFLPSGKYYTEENWRVPKVVPMSEGTPAWNRGVYTRECIGPYDMEYSPDFRRIDGGSVLVTSHLWGFPHLFPNGKTGTEG